MALQVKDKSGAFYKPMPVIEYLNECFGVGRGGGDRGGGGGDRGGARGGRGGSGYGDRGGSVTDQNFWMKRDGTHDRQKKDHAEKLLKGLMVGKIAVFVNYVEMSPL